MAHEPLKQLRYTMAAKTIADNNGIDLKDVPPTGAGYTIRKQDVEKYLGKRAKETPKEVAKA